MNEAASAAFLLASARVLEKNGFRLEETKVSAVVKGGKAMDVRVYVKA